MRDLHPGQPVGIGKIHYFIQEIEAVKGPDTPKGTIALMLVYVVIIVELWSNVYFTMLSRGITQ